MNDRMDHYNTKKLAIIEYPRNSWEKVMYAVGTRYITLEILDKVKNVKGRKSNDKNSVWNNFNEWGDLIGQYNKARFFRREGDIAAAEAKLTAWIQKQPSETTRKILQAATDEPLPLSTGLKYSGKTGWNGI